MRLSLSSSTSTWHSHPDCRSSRSQMFFKRGVPKNFVNVTRKHRCFLVKFEKFLRTPFFTEHLRWLLLCCFSCFFFYFSLAAVRSLLPYSTVTFFIWKNTFVFISLHLYYHNSQMIHQVCGNRYDLLYCHFHDSYTY